MRKNYHQPFKLVSMEKGTVLIYHSPASMLNGNEYTVQRVTETRTFVTGNIYPDKLGQPRDFQFNMENKDLAEAIAAGIYTIKTN